MDSERGSPIGHNHLARTSSLRAYNSNRTSLVRRNQSLSAKQVRFYRNGDRYFGGLKLAVSQERYKEFDSLLAELSEKLDLPTGAVRFIFNADDNSMITDISQLQYGIPYVCSSTNSFRQIDGGYGKHLHSWSIINKAKDQSNTSTINNSSHAENLYSNLRIDCFREFIKPKLVTVIRNSKPPQKKVTLLLNCKTAISLDQVLDQLSAKGSLGKVEKLYTVDGRSIKTLRDLFDDDTVFISLSTNEKFPDDGIELDPNSYRITPYRELKRPSSMTVRRSNSLRNSIRKYKDENENMSITVKNSRTALSAKSSNQTVAKPRGSALKRVDQNNKEELYPTSVFESESESARAKKSRRPQDKHFQSMDIYNTVWLSDFESVHSCGTRSGFSSLNQSRANLPENSINHSTPRNYKRGDNRDNRPHNRGNSKSRLHRTLSLPESDLATLNGDDLQERFSRLQIEQENRELRMLVRQLQDALEKLEKAMVNNLTNKADSNLKTSCSTCTLCTQKTNENKSTLPVQENGKLGLVHSPDSLEENNSKSGSEKDLVKYKDRTDSSGYHTLTNDTLGNDITVGKDDGNFKLKEYQYMEYSDSLSYSSEEERQYFESRLSKRRKGYYDDYDEDGRCCIMQ